MISVVWSSSSKTALPEGGLEVQIAGVLPGVAVDLEEGDVGEGGRGYFHDLGSILGDDAAELEDSDTTKDLWFA